MLLFWLQKWISKPVISLPIYILISIQLLIVTIGDIKYRKISNLWLIVNLVFATLLFILYPDQYQLEIASFQYTLAWIFGGFLLFLLRIMGGGDSKYIAVFFLLVPLDLQDEFMYFLIISTVFVGIVFFIRNIILQWQPLSIAVKNRDVTGVKSCFGSKFAYAPVILMAWILIGIKLQNLVSL